MAYVIAQLTDIHVGGPNEGSGERFSAALDEINAMGRQPDLVLLTGDNTHNSTDAEWAEVKERLAHLDAPWVAINGNHDRTIAETAGHRSMEAGLLRLVLFDTSNDSVTPDDASWLAAELARHPNTPTVIAMHHPPFETGIWWMDCVGLSGGELVEEVVRANPQVIKILAGHVHRPIQTSWGGCSIWVSPSTSVAVAGDIDPHHAPAETAEPPSFSLHAYVGGTIVSHVVPVGPSARRSPIVDNAPDFVTWVEGVQADRPSLFNPAPTSTSQ